MSFWSDNICPSFHDKNPCLVAYYVVSLGELASDLSKDGSVFSFKEHSAFLFKGQEVEKYGFGIYWSLKMKVGYSSETSETIYQMTRRHIVENINILKPTGCLYQQVLKLTKWFSARTVFMCFVFIWEQTATCATYSINWLVFITEMKSVYSAVRTGSLK